MPNPNRPRRSCLYIPGVNAKALEKAKGIPADVVLLDLEDSVAPEAKEGAREQLAAVIKAGGYGAKEVIARINALSTPWGHDDLKAICPSGPDGVLVPKVDSAEMVVAIDDACTEAGLAEDAALWVMIETPKAIFNLQEIADAAKATRLSGFVMGLNDLAKDTRAKMTPGREPFWTAMSLSVLAARSAGISIFDGVYNDIPNLEGCEAECRQSAEFGFDGRTLIHPSHVEIANRIYAPAEEEVAHARDVIAAFKLPENAGKGVIKVNGKMTELLHLMEAKRIVGMAEAIAALGG
jgi:citrate lyase subunit beta/citryl-CoA lyase